MAKACNTEILAHFVKNCEGQADLSRWVRSELGPVSTQTEKFKILF